MKKLLVCASGLALLALVFYVGSWCGHRRTGAPNAPGPRKVLYYVDPMNPAHTSDKPGLAPCGMKLEPVYAAEVLSAPGQPALIAPPPGSVPLTREKQQLIGVRTGLVSKKSFLYTKRLLGQVAVDETRVYWINATVDGWITKALPYATGDYVKSNQVLAAFYSPEFLSAGNALLFALNSQDRAKGATAGLPAEDSRLQQFQRNLQQYADALKNLGMGDPQIQEMTETRQFRQNVDILAPADGIILARGVSLGLRFEKGTELYRIADLSRVWILADVFEDESHVIQQGGPALVHWPQQQRTFTATVSAALPKFDPVSRTLKFRLEVENPDYALRPDMFVDLEFPMSVPECVFVPADALLDTGRSQSVFVEAGKGYFEPRSVKTGRRIGDAVEIVDGLQCGERIVVSGNFLLDSESRMKLAAASAMADGSAKTEDQDPVCGRVVTVAKAIAANRVATHALGPYYFCSDGCRQTFEATPVKYIENYRHGFHLGFPGSMASAVSKAESVDPVCGMKVELETAREAKRVSESQGKTYPFCSDVCKQKFDHDPTRFTSASTAKTQGHGMLSNTAGTTSTMSF